MLLYSFIASSMSTVTRKFCEVGGACALGKMLKTVLLGAVRRPHENIQLRDESACLSQLTGPFATQSSRCGFSLGRAPFWLRRTSRNVPGSNGLDSTHECGAVGVQDNPRRDRSPGLYSQYSGSE